MKNQSGLRQSFWIVALVMLMVGPASVFSAGTAQAQAVSFSRIVVKGNRRIEPATIRNFAAIPTGKPVTPGQIDAAYQRLIATGLFEDVKVVPSGGSLVIKVREYPTINQISFEGNKKIKDAKLAGIITSKSRHTYSPAEAESDTALIIAAYRQLGRYTAEVKPKIIRRSDNRVDLVFEIFEGKAVEIQRLSFVGNRAFSDRRLRRVLSTKQAGIFHAFVTSDTFVADRISFDKQVLTDFYTSRGYIDFQVLSVDSEMVRERDGFFLTFDVREGQPYTFGKITTTTDLKNVDADQFNRLIRLKTGRTYSPAPVATVVDRMEALATQKGMSFIRVIPKVTRNDKTLSLDINFVIERGPRIFVERIDIEGNDTTLDRVIRRQFTAVEGDPFNPREMRAAAARIKALGFFSKTDVTTRPGSSADRVIVDVNVKDKPTGSLSFGLSYGASSGIGGTISLSEKNFLGRGQFMSVNLGTGLSTTTYGLSFAEPAFLDRNVRLAFDLTKAKTVQRNAFYDSSVVGLSSSLTFPLSRNGKLRVGYSIGSTTINNVTGTASPIILADIGTRTSSAISTTYAFDSRTSGIRPTSGVLFRLTQEVAGLGGDSKYSKTTFTLGARTTTANEEITFSAELEGGVLVDASGASHISNRFFGGSTIIRGFSTNGIGPRDMSVANSDALGGNMYAVARLESTFPLGLPQEIGLAGGVFMDIGSVWGLNAGTIALSPTVDASLHLRSVIGFSLFWSTAIGPLRFNFTHTLVRQPYDVPETFSLSIGTRF